MWESRDHADRQGSPGSEVDSPASPATSRLRPRLLLTPPSPGPAPATPDQQDGESLRINRVQVQRWMLNRLSGCTVSAETYDFCVFVWFQPNLEGYEIHEVPLTKKDGQSLGISIIGCNPLTSQGRAGKSSNTPKHSEQPGSGRKTRLKQD